MILYEQNMRPSLVRLALYVLALGVLAGCSESGPYVAPPATLQNPPMYPHAQEVQVTPTTFYEDIPAKLVVFHTNDTPDAVLDFYQDALRKEGWTFEKENSKPGETLEFSGPRSCPGYSYHVTVKPASNGQTRVELEPIQYMCE